jgi:hypothetical protein
VTNTPIIAAEFTNGSKRRSPSLDITRIHNGERRVLHTVQVDSRRHARKVAAEHGATPWNF